MGPLDELTPDTWQSGPTLADVLPAASSALGFGEPGALVLPDAHTVIVLMVDGLGDLLLTEHADLAPTLVRYRAEAMRAGFPSTTAASLTSLGTGLCTGQHGILGYSFAPRDLDPSLSHTLNALRWTLDTAHGPDASSLFPPGQVQPMPTMFDDLVRAGTEVILLGPDAFRSSGLTHSAYGSPGDYRAASSFDDVLDAIRTLLAQGDRGPRLIYAYLPHLDAAGHRWGPGSPQWCHRLEQVDELVASITDALIPEVVLTVTGDHGMVTAGNRIDLDTTEELTRQVRAVAGEPRVRHLYTESGAADQVLARWSELLGDQVHLATRDQVIAQGWFGDEVAAYAAERIGDVVAVARGDAVLTRSQAEPDETAMPGHHGGWTAAELLVPLIVAEG
ncbi:hypothetical protein GOHSU_02_01670 [Gordonia hirsuta DSM 44140 = NBRC 16056]|uniref:Phosphodiesterase n=1 Tax=Gordonia hirsuta DSM 44140 = NBRC 16056 TaxID=1121927 RepID=L7L5L3_9ACTN|nr:nucleotide pyrophosphatase/phosphodiesterase family protein [Gordonia hirsuta]GAC56021.1 hypothetical protein GOHSU_02_01670 [Gordonia hirsuta DSM 44140 = NBRC 16056]